MFSVPPVAILDLLGSGHWHFLMGTLNWQREKTRSRIRRKQLWTQVRKDGICSAELPSTPFYPLPGSWHLSGDLCFHLIFSPLLETLLLVFLIMQVYSEHMTSAFIHLKIYFSLNSEGCSRWMWDSELTHFCCHSILSSVSTFVSQIPLCLMRTQPHCPSFSSSTRPCPFSPVECCGAIFLYTVNIDYFYWLIKSWLAISWAGRGQAGLMNKKRARGRRRTKPPGDLERSKNMLC